MKSYIIALLTIVFMLFTVPLYALDVTLQWDANTEPDLGGYKVYFDIDSGEPYDWANSPIMMTLDLDENLDPHVVEYTVNSLPDGVVWYFAVTAYDTQALESEYSNEVNTDDDFISAPKDFLAIVPPK